MVLQVEDASTMGAIYIAMKAMYPDKPLPVAEEPQIIEPNAANHQLYAKNFPLFKQVYADLKKTMQVLDKIK
jgi:gluconokinase